MAQIAKLGALTVELVTLITSITPASDPARFNVHRESALRTLRHNTYPRTNQFDVSNDLEGLEEKFRVFNEDPLADALRERLDVVTKWNLKWSPEVLHLLLELSDKPVSKSKLEALDALKEPEPNQEPPLQWKDLVAEEPLLQEKSVWRNVDFAAESSDDEGFEDRRSELSRGTDSTVQSSLDEEPGKRPEDFALDTIDKEALESLRKAQFWQMAPSVDGVKLETVKKPMTGLQAVREILFMLAGLPTSIYDVQPEKSSVKPSKSYTIKHVSTEAFYSISKWFAKQGSAILILRSWLKRPQTVPILQVFQGSVAKRIMDFDARLSDIQTRFVAPSQDVVVSLLGVQVEISTLTRQLLRLSDLIKRLDADRNLHSFRYLELLYDETCTSHMAGDDDMYAFMGTLFFECFQVYLRPIRSWMEEGDLKINDAVFFVSEISSDVDPASIWQSRYKIRQTREGVLHAPKFLRAASQKIFTTGTSVLVLKQLNKYSSLEASRSLEPSLEFSTVCNPARISLAPFPELFDAAFDVWIQSKHRTTSNTLRGVLFDSCGLHRSLEALSYIYFNADGSATSTFANSIFDKLDTLDTSWNDLFTLTELSQSTIGSHRPIHADHLRSYVSPLTRREANVKQCRKSVKSLSAISLKYRLSWPIQIILTASTIPSYQKIFTFLLQVRRSSHILARHRLLTSTLTKSTSADEYALYYTLRSRLLWFTSTLYHYLTIIVLKPNSQHLRQALKEAEDVDSMITAHDTYIKTTIEQVLLGSKLELIHQTILKVLDLAIELQDRQAVNEVRSKETADRQRDMMDLSMASLGLSTPMKRPKTSTSKVRNGASDDENDEGLDVELSLVSASTDNDQQQEQEEEMFIEALRRIKADFDRVVRFVAGALKGVARAGGGAHSAGEEASAAKWDVLGEMLEEGLSFGNGGS